MRRRLCFPIRFSCSENVQTRIMLHHLDSFHLSIWFTQGSRSVQEGQEGCEDASSVRRRLCFPIHFSCSENVQTQIFCIIWIHIYLYYANGFNPGIKICTRGTGGCEDASSVRCRLCFPIRFSCSENVQTQNIFHHLVSYYLSKHVV